MLAEGVAAQALQQAGIALDAVRAEIVEVVGRGQEAPGDHISFTPRAKKALELGHNYLGTEHILLGVIREGEGLAALTLVKLGADLTQLRTTVLTLIKTPQAPSGTE
jgi:ATP-dependent Clp protease ATP-binding subunit ClpC